MRFWESLCDLLLVIEIVVFFRSFHCAPLPKRHKISYHSWKITRSFPRTYVRTYYSLFIFVICLHGFFLKIIVYMSLVVCVIASHDSLE